MMNQYSYPSICIPRVFPNIKEPRIRKIFEDLNMAEIACIDIIEKTTEKGEKFNRVFIHFNQWYSNHEAVIARERLSEGKEVRIIYDDPWFWKVTAYKQIVVEKKKPVQKRACFQFDEGLKLRDFAPLQTERYRYNDVRRNQYEGEHQRRFQQDEEQRRSKLLQEQQMRQQLLQRRQQRQEEQQRQEKQRQPVTDFVPRSVAVKKPKKNKYNDIDDLTTNKDSIVNYGNVPYPQKKKKVVKSSTKDQDQEVERSI